MSQRGPRQYYYDSYPYRSQSRGGYYSPYSSTGYGSGYGQYPPPYAGSRYPDSTSGGYYDRYPGYDSFGGSGTSMYPYDGASGSPYGFGDGFGDDLYGSPNPYQGNYGPSYATSGMAVAGLVLSLVCLLFCWISKINNFVFIIAVIGFFLSLGGIIVTVMQRRSGRGMAVSALLLNSVAIAGVIVTQSMQGTNLVEQFQELGSQFQEMSSSSFQLDELTNFFDSNVEFLSNAINNNESSAGNSSFSDSPSSSEDSDDHSKDAFTAKITNYTYTTDVNGNEAILVEIEWTNDSQGARTANDLFSVTAFQGTANLESAYVNGADTYVSRNNEVAVGESAVIYAAFELANTEDVIVKIAALNSDQKDLAQFPVVTA